MNTTENKKLIAEFMGFEQYDGIRSESGKYFDYWAKENFSCIEEQEIEIESQWGFGLKEQDFLFAEQLKFHNDWNWLMQVVEKIHSLEDCNYKIEISHYTHIDTLPQIIYRKGTMIENTYNACVEFIKWHNENK